MTPTSDAPYSTTTRTPRPLSTMCSSETTIAPRTGLFPTQNGGADIGYGMIIAQQTLRSEVMYAQLIWLGLLGWAHQRRRLRRTRLFSTP